MARFFFVSICRGVSHSRMMMLTMMHAIVYQVFGMEILTMNKWIGILSCHICHAVEVVVMVIVLLLERERAREKTERTHSVKGMKGLVVVGLMLAAHATTLFVMSCHLFTGGVFFAHTAMCYVFCHLPLLLCSPLILRANSYNLLLLRAILQSFWKKHDQRLLATGAATVHRYYYHYISIIITPCPWRPYLNHFKKFFNGFFFDKIHSLLKQVYLCLLNEVSVSLYWRQLNNIS